MSEKVPATLFSNPIHFLAFGFGSGAAPFAPGTFGTLPGVLIYWLIQGQSMPIYIGIVAVVIAVGVPICGRTAEDLGVHDHGGIVWDEIAGYLLAMIAAPAGWEWMVVGFVLFRFFDIVKPWPISYLDKQVDGGLGIILDDLMAGLYALISIQLLAMYFG